jgi:hypothetical protein
MKIVNWQLIPMFFQVEGKEASAKCRPIYYLRRFPCDSFIFAFIGLFCNAAVHSVLKILMIAIPLLPPARKWQFFSVAEEKRAMPSDALLSGRIPPAREPFKVHLSCGAGIRRTEQRQQNRRFRVLASRLIQSGAHPVQNGPVPHGKPHSVANSKSLDAVVD